MGDSFISGCRQRALVDGMKRIYIRMVSSNGLLVGTHMSSDTQQNIYSLTGRASHQILVYLVLRMHVSLWYIYSRVSFFLASQWTENQRNKCVKITRIISGRRTMRMRAYNKYYYNNATSHFARHTLTQHICEVVQT